MAKKTKEQKQAERINYSYVNKPVEAFGLPAYILVFVPLGFGLFMSGRLNSFIILCIGVPFLVAFIHLKGYKLTIYIKDFYNSLASKSKKTIFPEVRK